MASRTTESEDGVHRLGTASDEQPMSPRSPSLLPLNTATGTTTAAATAAAAAAATAIHHHTTVSAPTTKATHTDLLRDLAHKRIATFVYFKRIYEGRSYYLNTLLMTPELLATAGDVGRLARRAYLFYVLGTSLGPLLDLSQAAYFAKALSVLAQEYDQLATEAAKTKRRMNLRKIRIPGDSNPHSGGVSGSDGTACSATCPAMLEVAEVVSSEYTRLELQRVPFELDYRQILLTLCDVMCETYSRLLELVGPCCDSAMWDTITKIDGRFKKIITSLSKSLDGMARHTVKSELATLDPLTTRSADADDDLTIVSGTTYTAADATSVYSL